MKRGRKSYFDAMANKRMLEAAAWGLSMGEISERFGFRSAKQAAQYIRKIQKQPVTGVGQ